MSYSIISSSIYFSKLFSLVLNKKGNLLGPYNNIYHDFSNLTFFLSVFDILFGSKTNYRFSNSPEEKWHKKINLFGIYHSKTK